MNSAFFRSHWRYAQKLVFRIERYLAFSKKQNKKVKAVLLHPMDFYFMERCGVTSFKGYPLKSLSPGVAEKQSFYFKFISPSFEDFLCL